MKEQGHKPAQSLSGLHFSSDEKELSHLMRLSQNGDKDSYTMLLKRLQNMLTNFVNNSFQRLSLSATGGEQDVVQEILIAIHTKRSNYDPSQFFLPWMYAIARYKIIDHLRKNKSHLRQNIPLVEDELENLEFISIHDFDSQMDIKSILKMLPDKQSTILKLVKIDGLSILEVSAKTGYSVSDIKVNVHRSIKTLQEKMQEKNYE